MPFLDVSKILDQLQTTELGKTLIDVLSKTKMPTIEEDFLDPGTHGEYNQTKNAIKLSIGLSGIDDDKKQKTTTAHELTHAALKQISDYIYDPANKFPETIKEQINKFDNFERSKPMIDLLQKMGASDYRVSWGERNAFGVGNTTGKQLGDRAVQWAPHADATAATEFLIRADLFNRGRNKAKESNK